MPSDFTQKTCRICLEKTESHISLHKTVPVDENKILISEILKYCGNIEVLNDDWKPQNACFACIKNAKVAYKFKLLCVQSDTTLNNKMINQFDPLKFKKEDDFIEINDVEILNIKDEELNNLEVDSEEQEESNDCFNDNDDAEQEESSSSNDEWERNKKVKKDDDDDDEWEANKKIKKVKKDDDEEWGTNKKVKKADDERKKNKKVIKKVKKADDDDEWKGNKTVKKAKKAKKKILDCPECGKSFKHNSYMLKHYRRHNKKCHYCDYTALNNMKLGWHMRKSHDDRKTLECYECNKRFFQKDNLKMHMQTHTRNRHICKVCGKRFASRKNLDEHLKCHPGEEPYKCDVCGNAFSQHTKLLYHQKKLMHGDKYKEVREQLERFENNDYSDDSDDIKREDNEGQEKSIENKRAVNVVPIEIKEKRYGCSQCGKRFAFPFGLRKHLRSHDKSDKKCPYCDFKSRGTRLGMHMDKNHDDQKTIQCPDCDRRFFSQQNLKQHLLIHTGAKDCVCEVCGMRFSLVSNLIVHRRRLHTDERPYPCSFCDLKFTTNNDRKRHMNIHTGEQMFKCDVCFREFNRKSILQMHLRTHTGEKSHVCEVCGKSYTQARGLRSHKASCHPGYL